MGNAAIAWAEQECGDADLGDKRRERRLVRVAAGALRGPTGTITGTFKGTAEREAAFRFVENESVDVAAIAEASYSSTARRCAEASWVSVPVDQTSLSVRDTDGTRGFGPIGSHASYVATGVHVMNTLAVGRDGATVGLLDQQWWVRPPKKRGRRSHDGRPLHERESHCWVKALAAAKHRIETHAPSCTPWFQLDRGGDCRGVLAHAVDNDILLTVRAIGNRRLNHANGRVGELAPSLRARPVAGHYFVDVPARPSRVARRARLAIRFMQAPIALKVSKKRRRVVVVGAVMVTEIQPPRGQEPLRWILLTTRVIRSFVDALHVVAAYTGRWRIEDFHKAWKSGACDIEASQLRARTHFQRWATIMAAVAARIERIKHLARTEPNKPASEEFSRDEIDAAILLRKELATIPYDLGDTPTVGELIRWLADFGGYMGSKRSPPPGTVVIARGLDYITPAAHALAAMRKQRTQKSG